jgi:hypothetical protein
MFPVRLDHAERAEYTLSAGSVAAAAHGKNLVWMDVLKGLAEGMVPAEGIEPTA